MISEERLVELHRWAFVGEYTTSSKYIMELVNGVRENLAEIRRLEAGIRTIGYGAEDVDTFYAVEKLLRERL